jgi:ribonuclease HI
VKFEIFVDASTVPKNPGSVGVGFSALVNGRRTISWASGGQGTSNYGEILAMAFALETLKPGTSDDVLIVTDSLYALRVVTHEWPAGVNQQVVDAVGTLLVGMRGVQFDLVSGHQGVPGNEMADFVSHQAGIQGMKDPRHSLYLPPAIGMHDLRILESRIIPKVHLLGKDLRSRVLRLHQAVFRGKLSPNAVDEQLIRDARKALGMEEAIP